MRKLYIRTADNLNGFYDLVGLFLEALLALLRDREHRCGTEGISGMYAKRIDIFDKADGNHVIFFVTDNFQLQLLPAQDGFFYKNLSHKARLKAAGAYGL